MGVAVLGEYVRVRWCVLDDDIATLIEQSGVTLDTVTALMDDTRSLFGLVPGGEMTLAGNHLREAAVPPPKTAVATGRTKAVVDVEDDEDESFYHHETVTLPDAPEDACWTGPGPGRWLVLVENAAHCWAALHGVGPVRVDEIRFVRTRIALPGADPMLVATPATANHAFKLIDPPSLECPRQAGLRLDGRLGGWPWKPEKGARDVASMPLYRAGVLDDAEIRWLDVGAGDYSVTATPVTALLRARLDLFGRELASRGIYFEDDASERGSELRHALPDGEVPRDFHEQDALSVYTVSGEKAGYDKEEQASKIFDPEEDLLDHIYASNYGLYRLPARQDECRTEMVPENPGNHKVGGQKVDDAWLEAHLTAAVQAAGLKRSGTHWLELTDDDIAAAAASPSTPLVGFNAVDAADRVQRAAYVLATHGTRDDKVEAALSQYRGLIVRALLCRDAFQLALAGEVGAAKQAVAKLPPLAPAPYPRRVHAAIELIHRLAVASARGRLVADALSAIDDPLERRLACLFASRIAAADDAVTVSRRSRDWLASEDASVSDQAAGLDAALIETVLGPIEPPLPVMCHDPVPDDPDETATHNILTSFATPELVEALRSRNTDTFARAWLNTSEKVRKKAAQGLFIEAVRIEAFDLATFLMENGASVAKRMPVRDFGLFHWGGNTALGIAVGEGSLTAVRWCLEQGAVPARAEWTHDKTLEGKTIVWPTSALVVAAKHGHAHILRHLLNLGGDPVTPIANGITPLTAAAFGGSVACVEMLLQAGADANQAPGETTVEGGPCSTTPLLYACDRGHDDIVCLLLDRGADPRVPRGDGELALQLAMVSCSRETIEALILAGADSAAVNADGMSVLHTLMIHGRTDVLPLVLTGGASIDLRAGDRAIDDFQQPRWTALMIAAAKGDVDSVETLLRSGADPLVVDQEMQTARDLARRFADGDHQNIGKMSAYLGAPSPDFGLHSPAAVADAYDETIALLEQAERSAIASGQQTRQ